MIRIFSKYYNMAQEGKVDFLSCPMHLVDQLTDEPVIFPLYPHESEDQSKVVLQCLACGYKITAGQQLYENIIERIRRIENGI
jgi:hypothetical protein